MNSKRIFRFSAVATAAFTALLLFAACGVDAPMANKYGVTSVDVNGSPVECIIYNTGNAGGISCNWEAYNASR